MAEIKEKKIQKDLLVVCGYVSVSGVLFSIGVCVCDLLIFLPVWLRLDSAAGCSRIPWPEKEETKIQNRRRHCFSTLRSAVVV